MVSSKCVNSSFDAFNKKLPKVTGCVQTFDLCCMYTTYMITAPGEIYRQVNRKNVSKSKIS